MMFRLHLSTRKQLLLLTLTVPLGLGCRGNPGEDPPVHWQRQMFTQDKGKAQRENTFFNDGRSMRPVVPGTVSTSAPIELGAYDTGKDEAGTFVAKWPAEVNVSTDLLRRGQDRYNIYCSPCHDMTGNGNGLVTRPDRIWGRRQNSAAARPRCAGPGRPSAALARGCAGGA